MKDNCVIWPQVKNKEGALVDSILFKSLLSITNNREQAKGIYLLTRSPEFQKWFNNSKVVDINGEPEIMWHSSNKNFNSFILPSGSNLARYQDEGIYFSKNPNYYGKSDVKYPVFLSIQNPTDINHSDFMKAVDASGIRIEDFRKGTDGFKTFIYFEPEWSGDPGHYENNIFAVAFDPNQVKSIYNNGQFNSITDNIYNKEVSDYNIKQKKEYYDRVEFANLYNGKNAKQVLENILKNTTNPLLQKVGQILLDNFNKVDFVKFRLTINLDDNNPARYDANTGLIVLNSNKSNKYYKESWNEYIIHELVHAYTVSGLSEPTTEAEKKFNIETRDIYLALERSKIKDAYGFTNRYEFIAEFLSNPQFREELQFKQPTLLKKLVNAFKKLLGIEVKSDIDLLTDQMLDFITQSTPSIIEGGFRILNKRKEGVVAEINSYASQRIEDKGNIKPNERFILQVHKKIKFKLGKRNNNLANLTKELKRQELNHKVNIRKIIADYTTYNQGIYDEGYKNSPLYTEELANFERRKLPLEGEIESSILYKTELASLLSDLDTTTDITVNEANYINLALKELDEIESRLGTYDLNTKEDQTQLAEDYLFTRLVNKTPEIVKLQETASNLSNKLLENISTYISTISETYLNTSGLGEDIKIDVESILETNEDITILGKMFEGFGDYPRLEAQLIHNITMTGKEKARLASLDIGQKIVDHMKNLQQWAKKNNKTNLVGQGSVRKAYAQLVDTNHLGRLDLVKPFTNKYYEDVNKYFKQAYPKGSNEQTVEVLTAKGWLQNNYYVKPTTGAYINRQYIYIQEQDELREFYEFFKQTMKDNYARLPEYINLKNEEKIPTMIRNSFWEFFSMRKDNIFKSTLLALKTILIGQGRAEFYDENGDPKSKFELAEFSQDDIKLRMIGEVKAEVKSFDLGNVLFEFTSFVNDYSEMTEVLPKVRMIQNIVETKEYVSSKKNGLFGIKKETIAGGQSRMYDAINLYVNGKIKGTEESPKWRLGGGDIVDNEGNVVGRKSYYASDFVRSLIKYTRVLQLGFNPFSGLNNILAGLMGDLIEASGGRYFTKRQLLKAISIYSSNSLVKGSNAFKEDKITSKLNLLSEYLQPLEEIGEWQDKRKISLGSPTLAGQALEGVTSNAFIFQEVGEDFVQKITMIAYLLNKKTPAGTPYWNMVDVENNELKYATEDNFDTKEELLKSRNTILDINHAIHGNYSKDNSSVYDGALLFDSALVFKKWIPYMIRNRFMSKRYNYRTGYNNEGFYIGGARGIAKSMNNMLAYFERKVSRSRDLVFNKKVLTQEDIIGLKKVATEFTLFLVLATISKILLPPPDEEKDKFYVPNFWEHLDISMWDSRNEFDNFEGTQSLFIKSIIDSSNRLSSEAIQMYDPSFYMQAYKRWALWSTITEGWDAIRETFRFLGADDRLGNRDLRFKAGANKGDLRVTKEITDLIPYYKQIERAKTNSKKTVEELQK